MKKLLVMPVLLCALLTSFILPENGFADPLEWTGGGGGIGEWSDENNWDPASTPQDMDSLTFTTGNTTNTNNLGAVTPLSLVGITFGAAAGVFDLTGNDIYISGSITNESANSQKVSLNLTSVYGLTVD